MTPPPLTDQLSHNYKELTRSYEETFAESQQLQLRHQALHQKVAELQEELMEWEMRARMQSERQAELSRQHEEAVKEVSLPP